MKKTYQNPTLKVLALANEDVLTSSKLSVSETPGIGDSVIW